jgi:cold shock CspA family protein
MSHFDSKLTRIGVFYDGNYFFFVSNYYNYVHPRHARISIAGLHEFIRNKVAACEGSDPKFCQIVDAHYFRGRLPAYEADARQKLFTERVFDDVLMREGIATHFLPITRYGEKGIDVWLALEAFELAILKRFDVLVLITCDGDYVPLIRKVNTLGARVMVLGWDFEYMDSQEIPRKTTTSRNLLNEATYPVLMHDLVDDKTKQNDSLLNGLFLNRAKEAESLKQEIKLATRNGEAEIEPSANGELKRGKILNLQGGYGFVTTDIPNKNLFFFWSDLLNVDFNDLKPGDAVDYLIGTNEKGRECAKEVRRFPVA